MLSDLKNLVKRGQSANNVKRNFAGWSDICIVLTVVLVALVSFGAGWLMAPQANQEPIIIYESLNEAENFGQTPIIPPEDEQNYSASLIRGALNEVFVGSINSNKYHWPECPSAKKIAPYNQIWFSSEEEAREAGYVRCGNFEKYEFKQ